MTQNPPLKPELGTERPKYAIALRGRLTIVWQVLLLVVIPTALVISSNREDRAMRALLDHGRPAQAAVTDIEERGHNIKVHLEFDADNAGRVNEVIAMYNRPFNVSVGGNTLVVYEPGNPANVVLGGPPSPESLAESRHNLYWGIPVVIGVLLGVICWTVLSYRRQLALARTGLTATARILGKYRAAGGEGLEYVFTTADGKDIEGRSRLPFFALRKILAQRSAIVVYDPNLPTRHSLLKSLRAVREVA